MKKSFIIPRPGPEVMNSMHSAQFFMLLFLSADFFKINFFKKFFQEHYQI